MRIYAPRFRAKTRRNHDSQSHPSRCLQSVDWSARVAGTVGEVDHLRRLTAVLANDVMRRDIRPAQFEPSNGPSYPPSQSCKTMRSTRMPWRPEKLGDGLQRSTGRKFVIGKPSFAPYAVATHRNAPLRVRTRSCNWQQSFRGLPVATAMNNSIRLPRSTARRRSGTLSNGSRRDEHRCPSYFRVFTSSSRARRYRSKARSRFGLAPENSSTP